MRRKTAQELLKTGNHAAARRRKVQEASEGFGAPIRPQGMGWATRRAWNALEKEYQNVLQKSDGPLLQELIAARAEIYRGAGERKEAARIRAKEIESQLASRKPVEIPEQTVEQESEQKTASISLRDFLAATQQARDTFAARLVPDQTMMMDVQSAAQAGAGEPTAFEWPDDDPTTRARSYAMQCVQGAVLACDLHVRACARFLDDLEQGHEKGFFYDPLAARQIVEWFTIFLGRDPYDWQLFVLVNLFGFRRPSGLRRFLECWTWVARQNGKSSLNAGVGLWFLICEGEPVSAVYSAATTADQAGISFRDAKRLIKANPELKEYVKAYRASLTVEDTDATFQPLASEVASLDGLRPACLLADEVHEWDATAAGREQWAKLTSGMVSRRHPLTMAISTAGGAQRGFAWEKYTMVKNILQKVVTAEDVFCSVWELEALDDCADSSLWVKANPSLGQGLKIEALQRQFRETQADPSSLSHFLRYQCGRWTEFKRNASTFSFAKIDACRGYPNLPRANAQELLAHFLEHNAGLPSYGGYDYGEVSDMACLCLLYPRVTMSDGSISTAKVMIAEFWTPGALVAQHEKEWGVPLSAWVRDGWIKTCDGDMNDPRQLKKDLLEIINAKQQPSGFPAFNMRSIHYDQWHSRPFMVQFAEETSIPCVEIDQFPRKMTPLCVALKTAVLSGQLWHLDNPVIRWMLSNVILERSGKYDAIAPDKPNKHSKIDAVQALLDAWAGMDEGAPTERAPRCYFIGEDNSVSRSGSDGKLEQIYGPLTEKSQGSVQQDQR